MLDTGYDYRLVEYIKSTGTQCIKTEIIPSYYDYIELDVKFDSGYSGTFNNNVFCGIQNAGCWLLVSFEQGYPIAYDYAAFYLGWSWYEQMSQNHVIPNVDYTSRNTVILHYNQCSYGNLSCTLTEAITQQPPTLPFSVFGITGGSGRTKSFDLRPMILYGLKHYDSNSVLLHDLRPAERSDGELGLLDIVTLKFYTNSGTGEFVRGEYLSSEYWHIYDGNHPFRYAFPFMYNVDEPLASFWDIIDGALPFRPSFPQMYTVDDAPSSFWRIKDGDLPYRLVFPRMYPYGYTGNKLYKGNRLIKKIYLGDTKIKAVYNGDTKIF